MEQFSGVGGGKGRPGRNRVSSDGAEARTDGCLADLRTYPPSRTERGKGGATTERVLTGEGGPAPLRHTCARDGFGCWPTLSGSRKGCPTLVSALLETGWDYTVKECHRSCSAIEIEVPCRNRNSAHVRGSPPSRTERGKGGATTERRSVDRKGWASSPPATRHPPNPTRCIRVFAGGGARATHIIWGGGGARIRGIGRRGRGGGLSCGGKGGWCRERRGWG
jgi:hypothetical protein